MAKRTPPPGDEPQPGLPHDRKSEGRVMARRLKTAQTVLPRRLRNRLGMPVAREINRVRRASSCDFLLEVNVTKILVVAISLGAALAVFPAAAQTGYGVKKHAPSTSTFDRGWNHANESKDRARAGAGYVRRHHASPLGL
jgi:hypothetical protein